MPATSSKRPYARGVATSAPFALMAAPFGAAFGVIAAEAGLNLAQIMGMTAVVIAGASQFAAVQLLSDGAPVIVVIASALAVNMRMMMYSAALQPHLGRASLWQRMLIAYANFDQTYAVSTAEYENKPDMPLRDKALFFIGAASPMVPVWIGSTWAGAVLGAQVPDAVAIDFAMPIMFLALIGPALRTKAHIAAAVTAVILALAFAWMPYNLGLIAAALPAMAVGAELERRGYGR